MSDNDVRETDPIIPGFEILRPLGRGGMGEVYLAKQLNLGRLVALKLLASQTDFKDELLARFRREAELLAAVSHPNIVTIHDYGDVGGRPYLVLEYLNQGDLRAWMKAESPMKLSRILRILEPIKEGLNDLHRRGILHRDLKPENVLIDWSGQLKLADFGIAVLKENAGVWTKAVVRLGTPGYCAPEQHYGLPIDEHVDQYSMAAMGYEMLTGQLPLGSRPKPPSHWNPSITPQLDQVLLRALQEDPEDRFETLDAFFNAFRESSKSTEDRVPPPQEPQPKVEDPHHRTTPPRKRKRRLVTLGMMLGVSLAVGLCVNLIDGPFLGMNELPGWRIENEPPPPPNTTEEEQAGKDHQEL